MNASKLLPFALAFTMLLTLSAKGETAGLYTIIDLGTLGGTISEARAINDGGQVVGSSQRADGSYHAFLWDAVNGMQDLGTLGGTFSTAFGINNSGQVVGYSETGSGFYRAFLWDATNGMRDLGTLGGTNSYAYGINDAGQIVGGADGFGGLSRAFLWDATNGMRDLGTLGGDHSHARAISSAGQVVGSAQTVDGTFHAFLWNTSEGMRDLGTLPGQPRSDALAINSVGQVVGIGYEANFVSHGFLWDTANGMRDLGTLGGIYVEAWSINDIGQIVGSSQTAGPGFTHAFIWVSGVMEDLGTLPNGNVSQAYGINNLGQIVGVADAQRAVLWQPLNQPPVAMPQSLTTPENTPLVITLAGSDPEGDPLTFTVVSNPGNGTLTGVAPNLIYTPNANFTGSDSFAFIVSDGQMTSAPATVSISVIAAQLPVAATVEIKPEKWNIRWGTKTGNGKVSALIGNISGHSAREIDPASIRLNGTVPVAEKGKDHKLHAKVKKHRKGFDGSVLEVKFNKFDAFRSLEPVSVGQTVTVKVTGKLRDGTLFEGTDTVLIVGKE